MMLTGTDLLAKVNELGDASKSELVRSTGYVSLNKDGSERLNFTAFYEALLKAKGVSLGQGGAKSATSKISNKLKFVATVQGNGNLLIGKAYTSLLGLRPGDKFEIKLGRKQIILVLMHPEDIVEFKPPLSTKNDRVVPIWFATDREPEGDVYGNRPSNCTLYGRALVYICARGPSLWGNGKQLLKEA